LQQNLFRFSDMFISETTLRVRYGETDQMGIVYYGNYAQYYEVGRVDAMRNLGASYLDMEKNGIVMPILSMNIKYIRPAKYDDLLTVKTIINEMPTTRILFKYEIFNETGTLLNIGDTELVFVDKKTFRPCKSPQWFLELLEKKFI